MLRMAPVSRPMAKKVKYMTAAGCCTVDVVTGLRWNSTGALLFSPINTSNAKIAVTNTVLISMIIFITT